MTILTCQWSRHFKIIPLRCNGYVRKYILKHFSKYCTHQVQVFLFLCPSLNCRCEWLNICIQKNLKVKDYDILQDEEQVLLVSWYYANIKYHLSELQFVPSRTKLNRSDSLYKKNAHYLRKQGDVTAHRFYFSGSEISVCLNPDIHASCWVVFSRRKFCIGPGLTWLEFIPLLLCSVCLIWKWTFSCYLFSVHNVTAYILLLVVNINRENTFEQLHWEIRLQCVDFFKW